MKGEMYLFGVFLNSELVTSVIGLVLAFLVFRVLVFFGVDKYIWHHALFEASLFIVCWGVSIFVINNWVLR